MKIDKIQKLKNNKYKIIIDDEAIVTFDNVILEQNLLYKKNIDKDLYEKIINDTEYYNIYDKAFKYSLRKRRSEKEIKIYLINLNIEDHIIDKIILQLKKINLINDIEYCRAFINDRVYLSKNGIDKIKYDLLNQNISIDIIDKELDNIDKDIFYNRLEKMIQKKIKTNTKYSNYKLKQKILNDMLNLGYNKELILEIIETNIENNFSILEKEYNKLYNNLIKKYTEKETLIKVKQKLLYKGFNIDDINKLIVK